MQEDNYMLAPEGTLTLPDVAFQQNTVLSLVANGMDEWSFFWTAIDALHLAFKGGHLPGDAASIALNLFLKQSTGSDVPDLLLNLADDLSKRRHDNALNDLAEFLKDNSGRPLLLDVLRRAGINLTSDELGALLNLTRVPEVVRTLDDLKNAPPVDIYKIGRAHV